ncbi:phosphate uptake regulator PhoU [Chlamydiota bacterium]
MFKNLLDFWKGKNFLTVVLEEFDNMISLSQKMYTTTIKVLVKGDTLDTNLKDNIYDNDRKINELERDIRKKIVEHLVLQPSVDITVCLVLMSVVKDAERLGDYCKNLYEIIELHHGPLGKKNYETYLKGLEDKIMEIFTKTRKAFKESDEATSQSIIVTNKDILSTLTEALNKIAASDLTAREAVSLAATTRYFRRITSHLGNIASSVVMPVTDLDYFDEKRME